MTDSAYASPSLLSNKSSNRAIAVSLKENRSKGKKDPSEWMPSDETYHCEYIRIWTGLKKYWKLKYDDKEEKFLNQKSKECSGFK